MTRPSTAHRFRVTTSLACLLMAATPATAEVNAAIDPDFGLYRESLLLWSESRETEAVETLIDLRQRLGGLPGALLDVDGDLSAGRPRVLVPILGLFTTLHAADVQRDRLSDAGDVRQHLKRLAKVLLDRSPRTALSDRELSADEARTILSRAWSSAGAALRDGTYLEEAYDWFLQALELDPANVGAAMTAGAIDEKIGRYPVARKRFEKVLEVVPDHPQARLRRALSMLRAGSRKPAEDSLAEISRSDAPFWIRVLAFEEQAQSLAEGGEREQALEVTLAGREFAPEEEGLLLLQIWLRGDRTDASRALLRQAAGPPQAERLLSPRAVYNLWPPDLDRTLERWRQDVDNHRPLLRRALLSERL